VRRISSSFTECELAEEESPAAFSAGPAAPKEDPVQASLIERVVSEMLPFKVEKVVRPAEEQPCSVSAEGSPCGEFESSTASMAEEEDFLPPKGSNEIDRFFSAVEEEDLADLFLRY